MDKSNRLQSKQWEDLESNIENVNIGTNGTTNRRDTRVDDKREREQM